MSEMTSVMNAPFGKAVTAPLPYERAIETAKALLKEEGFGILCEIDVAKTLKEKINVDFRPYRILGACNPGFAHQSLTMQPQLGLLLPCNVVVQEVDGRTIVSAVDARVMLSVTGADLDELADEVNLRLSRVLEKIEKAG
jgi:uncharacterized protein (DUF302 family)